MRDVRGKISLLASLLALGAACGDDPAPRPGGGVVGGRLDAGSLDDATVVADTGDGDEDTGPVDLGPPDAGFLDFGVDLPDANGRDAAPADVGLDAGPMDTGAPDLGPPDTGAPDTGPPDMGTPDTGPPDTGPPDTGPPDTGPPDTGPVDTGPPPVTCTEPGMVTRTISDSASVGTPDTYFFDVNPGDPFCADIAGGGGGRWTVNMSNGTTTGIYCSGSARCRTRIRSGDPTVLVTAVTTDIGSYTLVVRYMPR